MKRAAAEMETERKENLLNGKGTVSITHVFRANELKANTDVFARLHIPAGASIGFHRHVDDEEVFYVLSGRGIFADNGTKREIGPGDALLTGDGAGHAIENTGEEPLELIAVVVKFA